MVCMLSPEYQRKTLQSHCSVSIKMKQKTMVSVFKWFQLFALGKNGGRIDLGVGQMNCTVEALLAHIFVSDKL